MKNSILRKNNFESSDKPASRDNKGSGGVGKGYSTTFPDAQHMPDVSFRNFNAWQYWHTLSIAPIAIFECKE